MIKGYYVDVDGRVITITEKGGEYFNHLGQVMLVEEETLTRVLIGEWESDGFSVDAQAVFWSSLKDLASAIED
ncbi:hypothetical protein KUA24_59 [Vibrio phage HNL01]|nr:hypothetical protein KUA24_59 [Vibrio phage HNL01]